MYTIIRGVLVGVIIVATIGSGDVAVGQTMTPLERVASTPKGQLKDPYTDVACVAEEGRKIYMSLGCNGCDGGGGGGGMGPPLTNPIWIYGDDERYVIPVDRAWDCRVPEAGLPPQGFRGGGRADATLRQHHQDR